MYSTHQLVHTLYKQHGLPTLLLSAVAMTTISSITHTSTTSKHENTEKAVTTKNRISVQMRHGISKLTMTCNTNILYYHNIIL